MSSLTQYNLMFIQHKMSPALRPDWCHLSSRTDGDNCLFSRSQTSSKLKYLFGPAQRRSECSLIELTLQLVAGCMTRNPPSEQMILVIVVLIKSSTPNTALSLTEITCRKENYTHRSANIKGKATLYYSTRPITMTIFKSRKENGKIIYY